MKVIEVKNISKKYRLGYVGGSTLASDLSRMFARIKGKEDPTKKIGIENRLDTRGGQYVWALKDINLSVEQGDVFGIIGKNGAGKSTLLKILSKVTAPTSGTIKIKGRIASLLEVGTGFHPELSGRENIYLNGAILGMTKAEIRSRFDEIVDFSGVEKYIDTPVKRYSSGMYVRLAFAVAAHLDPEILVVDEVLSVGDAEFQKKALGKMHEVSKGYGRTILFVSHNMASLLELCEKGILLQNGMNIFSGSIKETVVKYLSLLKTNVLAQDLNTLEQREGNGNIQFTNYEFTGMDGIPVSNLLSGHSFRILMNLRINKPAYYKHVHISMKFVDEFDRAIFHLENTYTRKEDFSIYENSDKVKIAITVDDLPVPQGRYYFHLFCSDLHEVFDDIRFAGEIFVEDGNFFGTGKILDSKYGMVLIRNKWELLNE